MSRFWRFLSYERSNIAMFGAVFLLTVAGYWLDSRSPWSWQTFWYTLGLVSLVTAAYLGFRYMRHIRAVQKRHDEDSEPMSLEAEAYRGELEETHIRHIRALNEVHAKQKEYYDFIVSWFHEIKTPISVLRLLQQTKADARSVEEEVTRIEHYVDQALYYAKLDNFSQDYEIVSCDLETLVKGAVKAHAKSFISRKMKLRLDIPPAIVQSDPKWLLFIVNQLITNSLKYTGDNGEITLSARVTQDEKQLVLRDNGIGIDAKDVPRVFNRGFTGANGRSYAKSTGMGLYLAQELSRKLGHYLTCESAVGSYTVFTIHFPKHHDPYLNTVGNRESAAAE